MKRLFALQRERKRSQRGSVLSGVLIITAFLSIIGGALMTELSTGFLLSRVMVNRVNTQATVSSAAELALDQLQGTPRDVQCPALNPTLSLNGQTAAVNYTLGRDLSCALVTDSQWLTTKTPLATWSPFTIDGAHVQLRGLRDAYLVSGVNGEVSVYDVFQTSLLWSRRLGGTLSGPPIEMLDQANQQPGITTLVPLLNPNDRGISPNCDPSRRCVAALIEYPPGAPRLQCFMSSIGSVKAPPAASRRITNLVYFGDDAGNLYAYTTTGSNGGDGEGNWQGGNGGGGGNCSQRGATAVVPGAQPVRGVVALRGSTQWTDEVYVLTDSQLVAYTASLSGLSRVATRSLQRSGAVGLAVDSALGTAPARIAISFQGGAVQTWQIGANYAMSRIAEIGLGAGITSAPYWSPGNLIGVGLINGTLNVLDPGLTSVWTYAGAGPISTTPATDPFGDWFFGDDTSFYKLHPPSAGGTAMRIVTSIRLGETTGSSSIVGGCATGVCAYLGTLSSHLYMIPFDARSVTLTACLSDASPTCSGANPRLWVNAEVGDMGSQRTVRVKGWSYYSG